MRVIQATEEELPLLNRALEGRMIGLRNELAAYKALRDLVVARMGAAQAEEERRELGDLLLSTLSKKERGEGEGESESEMRRRERRVMALTVKVEERELLQVSLEQ